MYIYVILNKQKENHGKILCISEYFRKKTFNM